jgi:hypothetical protein
VKRQLAAMERSDGLQRFVFLALLAAVVAGGFAIFVHWLSS